jgi:ABC-type dipeptide/oligopeptide/nickel transport system permease component
MNSVPPPVEYQPPSAQSNEMIPRTYIIVGVVVAVVLVVLTILGVIWLARTQGATMEALRDIMIIVLALESCVFGIVLMLLLLMFIRLINMLEFEIKPILEKTNETLGTVRGTTTFVSNHVVKPVSRATSYVAGFRSGLRTLFGDPRRNIPD